MDADLTAALGSTPTVNERLYAAGLQDTRNSTAQWTQNNATWAADIANVQTFRQKLTSDITNQQSFRKSVVDFTKWVQAQYALLPPEIFDNNDELYERCVMRGLDLRKQTMSTSTSQTTIDDVINDGFKIGGEIFRRIQDRKAKVLAGTLKATDVPPVV